MRKRLSAGLLIALAVAAAVLLWPSSSSPDRSPPASREARAESASGEGRFAALPARAPLGELRSALFAPLPAPRPPLVAAPQAPAKPVPPQMPYRVAGRVTHDDVVKVVLVKGDVVLLVEEGEALEGGYRVESIGANEITPASARSRKSERRRAAYASQ